jgi:hypothetical protein
VRANERYRSKFSTWALVLDHYDTLRDARTGRRRLADHLIYLGLPVGVAVAAGLRGVHASHVPDVLAAAAILTGLIFNVFVGLFDLTTRASDQADKAHGATLITLADELRANVSYAVLLGLALTGLLGYLAMFTDTDNPLNTPVTGIIIFLSLQLVLTVSMVLKRIRSLYRGLQTVRPERIP